MKKLVIVFLLFSFNYVFAQTFLWSEDFTGEDGLTSGTATGGTWSVTTPPSGTFRVDNRLIFGEVFMANNTATEGVWQSNVFSIASTGMATISITLFGFNTYATDYMRVYYKVDGGPEVLFAELTETTLETTTTGSAIVSGTNLQLVVRSTETNTGTVPILGNPYYYYFDNIVVTSVPALYSCATANWNVASTWSTVGFAGPCNAASVPNTNQVAVIGGGFRVDLTADANVGGVDVRSTGTLRYTTTGLDLGIDMGLVRVRNGGIINRNGQNDAQIDFRENVSGGGIQVDAGGALSIDDVTFINNANTLHYLSGGGTLTINDDILFSRAGVSLINNMTSAVSIGDQISFTSTTSTFTNNGTVTAASINANGNNDNVFNNSSGATIGISTIDLANGNFTVNNSGTVNQSGNFLNIDAGSNGDFNNLSAGVWNWSYVPGTAFDADMATVLDCSAAGNTFNYNGAGAQTIINTSYSNLSISNSGTKQPSAALDINGNLLLQNAAILNSNSVNITLAGNWNVLNTASFTPGSQTVTFDGSGTQTITNSSGQTFNNLALNLGAVTNIVQLQSNVTVSNVLTLTAGGLNLNGSHLTLLNSANTAITTVNGYLISEITSLPYSMVIWNMRTTIASYNFPLRDGAGGNSIPVVFNKTSAGVESGTGAFSVTTFHTAGNNTPRPSGVLHTKDPSGNEISHLVADRFWIITPLNYQAGSVPNATVTFNVTSSERPPSNPPLLVAQRWNATSLLWDNPIASQTSTATSAQVAIPGTFSAWALSASSTPLPIELTDFEALQQDDHIVLNWTTATELNNDFFTVERLNKKDAFDEVIRVPGKGTTKEESSYESFDFNPLEGKNYYRLKQTDFDGKFSYSKIVMADFKVPEESFKVYPNPARNEDVTIELRNIKPLQEATLEISNMLGMKAVHFDLKADDNGRIKATVANGALPRGIYIVNVKAGESMKRKIIIE